MYEFFFSQSAPFPWGRPSGLPPCKYEFGSFDYHLRRYWYRGTFVDSVRKSFGTIVLIYVDGQPVGFL